MTSHDLLTQWSRERNELAFRELVARHAPMVFNTSKRILGNEIEAQDVTQECFETLALTRRPPREHLGAWLHRVATNRCLDRLRASKHRAKRETDFAERQFQPTATEWKDVYDLVDAAIAELPQKFRASIIAHFLEGRSQTDIANELNLTRQAVNERIRKGIDGVRAHLKRRGIEIFAVTLVALLGQNASAAAIPLPLTASLGKLALAGHTTVAMGTFAGVGVLKLVAAVILTVSIITAGVVLQKTPRDDTFPASSPPATPAVAATQTPIGSTPAVLASQAVTNQVEAQSVTKSSGSSWPNGPSTLPPPTVVHGRLKEPDGGSISGIVVRADGKAYPDAQVAFEPLPFHHTLPDPPRGPIAIISTNADANGAFHKNGLKPGEYSVQVTQKGAMTGGEPYELTRVTLKENEHKSGLRLVYGVEGKLTITGKVANRLGEPYPELTVSARNDSLSRTAVTDSAGRFTLESLSAGEYRLDTTYMAEPSTPRNFGYVVLSGHTTASAGDKDVTLLIPRSGTVEGCVVHADTGAPITSYKVVASRGNMPGFRSELTQFMIPFVNPEGKFRIPDVEPGDNLITVLAEGFSGDSVVIKLEDGQILTDVVVKLSPGHVIKGRVIDDANQPVRNAEIRLGEITDRRERRDQNIATHTDDKGEFKIRDMPKHLIAINALHPGFAPAAVAPVDNLTIVLRPAPRLSISVNEGGEPLAEAAYRVRFAAESRFSGSVNGQTDSKGNALIDDVLPGWARVSAYIPKVRGREVQKYVFLEPGLEAHLAFDFKPVTTALEGMVTWQGAPVGPTHVFLWIDVGDGIEEFMTTTTPEGGYWFDKLPAGTASLRFSSDEYSLRRPEAYREITLAPGDQSRLDVHLTGTAQIEGRFVGFDNSKHLVAVVHAGHHTLEKILKDSILGNGGFRPTIGGREADANGHYLLESLEPGDYTVVGQMYPSDDWVTRTNLSAIQIHAEAGQTAIVNFRK